MAPHARIDRHIEDAKAHLVARLEELGRRFHDARAKLDVPAYIAAHPLAAVGTAFALGILVGRGRRDRVASDGTVQRGLGATALAALGALAIRLAKDLAARYASDAAKSWLDRRDTPSPTERAASRDPSVEPFLRH